jgi:hypothetical protein
MSEPFTFDDVDTTDNEFDDLPPGTYTALIEECVTGTSSKGTPELRVQFRIQTGDFKNRVISDWLYFNQNTQQIIATKLVAAGVQPPTGIKTADQAPARVSGLIHNRYVDIVVREDTYNGETRTKVKAWKPTANAQQPAVVGGGSAPDDDDIPFHHLDQFEWVA